MPAQLTEAHFMNDFKNWVLGIGRQILAGSASDLRYTLYLAYFPNSQASSTEGQHFSLRTWKNDELLILFLEPGGCL